MLRKKCTKILYEYFKKLHTAYYAVGRKIIRALEIIRVKKFIPNEVLQK